MAQRQPLVINPTAGGDGVQQMQAGDSVAVINGGRVKYRGSVAVQTGTSLIPISSSAPTSTQGTQIWSATITPTALGSTMEIDFSGVFDSSASGTWVTVAIFKGTTLLGFATAECDNFTECFRLLLYDPVTSLTAITYSCRIGISTNGTWYLGRPASQSMGGVNPSNWSIIEEM